MLIKESNTEISDFNLLSTSNISTNIGKGFSFCHHGEILQGAFYCKQTEEYVYGLTTLKCNLFWSKAYFIPKKKKGIHITPPSCVKAKNGIKQLLKHFKKDVDGELVIQSTVLPKLGLGSSTADVLSAMWAVAETLQLQLTSKQLAKLAVKAELASDSLMYTSDVLFAHRKGIIIEEFPRKLPLVTVLGFDEGSYKNGMDTLQIKPIKYSIRELKVFEELRIDLLKSAINQDITKLGQVATRSALINQKHFPKKKLIDIIKIQEKYNALGVQISHSGSIAGIIWNPTAPNLHRKIEACKEELKKKGLTSFWLFNSH